MPPKQKKAPQDSVGQDKINSALWAACDTFRGTVDSAVYKDYLLTMLFLKYLSDVWQDHYDDYKAQHGDSPELIEELLKNERFVLPKSANFYALYEQRYEPGNGERIDKALHAIEDGNGSKLRDGDHGVFQDISFNSTKLGDEAQKNDVLRHLLEDFNKPELDLRPSRVGKKDIIGDAYEYLIDRFAAGAGKKAGEFYTPAAVSELIAELVVPKKGDDICDRACGSASLLMKCGRQIKKRYKGSKQYQLFGQEAIGSTWALAKMNMFLHREDNHIIKWGDTLRNPRLLDKHENLRYFDVVVANPPFSLEKWGHDTAGDDRHNRFLRGVPPRTKGDYAFILHMIEIMKAKTGRMGVVVPHGVLFRGSSEGKIRTKLIEENLLDAVIGLPEKLFYGTGIPAAILIFKKKKQDDKVLFIDASREYRDVKNQNQLTDENIAKIVAAYKTRESVDKYAYLAGLDEIRENDFNLNIPRYVDTFEEEEEIDLVAVRKERSERSSKLNWQTWKKRWINILRNWVMVPEGWHIYKLGDLGCGSRPAVKAGPFGSSLKKYFYVSEGYKIYGQEQVIKNDAFYGDYFINEGKFAELESCSVLPGDILVSLVGTLGKILLIPNNASKDIINPRLIRISPDKNKTEPLYLKYYLEDKWTQNLLLRRAQGGTMGVLNAGVFKSLPLLLPPLCEQFEIAQILSTWDKAIETTEKLIDNSKAQRKALMQQLLTGKRRFPEFSNKWVKTRLCYIAYINPCKPEKPEDEQVSFVSMDSVSEHARLLRFENRQYSEVEKGFTSFINNDVLVAKITPCFENGKGAYAKELTNGIGFGSTEFHVIRAKNGICSKLIYHITNSFEFRFHGRANMQGSAGHKRVPTDYLRLYKFYWPVDFKEQTKIANMLDTVASEIEFLSNETAALTNQKKALMQQLLTGKYRVKVDNLRTTEVTA